MPDLDRVSARLAEQAIELPSWAFGNSGTRFKVFAQPGVPRDPFEKISDAAQVHLYTGLAPTVALHIPWDRVASYRELREHAQSCAIDVTFAPTSTGPKAATLVVSSEADGVLAIVPVTGTGG